MSVSIMTETGLIEVPTRSGGVNLELLARLRLMEERITGLQQELDSVKNSRAGNEPGLTRLSSSQSVTDSTGLALPTSENNAAIAGTLANRIEAIRKAARYTCSENTSYISNNWSYIYERNNIVIASVVMGTKTIPGYTGSLIASCPLGPVETMEAQTVTDKGIVIRLSFREDGRIYIYPKGDLSDDIFRSLFVFLKKGKGSDFL